MTNTIADALRAAIDLLSATRETFAAEVMLREYDDALDKLRAALAEHTSMAEEIERLRAELADVANDSKWLGPFTTASEALNELRMAVATMMGCDQSTWPDHGNAPLAIAAAFAIRQTALEEWAPE